MKFIFNILMKLRWKSPRKTNSNVIEINWKSVIPVTEYPTIRGYCIPMIFEINFRYSRVLSLIDLWGRMERFNEERWWINFFFFQD